MRFMHHEGKSLWYHTKVFTSLMMLLVFLSPAATVQAQTEAKRNPFHYVRTHKVLLLSDLVAIGGLAAESVTSQQCLNAMAALHVITSNCAKQGYWGLKIAPLFVISNHLAYHYAPAPELRYVTQALVIPLTVDASIWTSVNHNQTYWLWRTGCYPCFAAAHMPDGKLPPGVIAVPGRANSVRGSLFYSSR
jgi:hypothetical protein